MNERLLDVNSLQTYFYTSSGVVKAVDGVSLSLDKGKTLGIVGESGSGKSVTASSIMRLIPSPPGKIVGGEIIFEGKDVLNLSEKEFKHVTGLLRRNPYAVSSRHKKELDELMDLNKNTKKKNTKKK